MKELTFKKWLSISEASTTTGDIAGLPQRVGFKDRKNADKSETLLCGLAGCVRVQRNIN